MRTFKALRGMAVVACLAVGLMGVMASGAMAEAATHCVKATKTTVKPKHYTGGYTEKNCATASATHEGKFEYIKASSLSEPEQEELKAILKYVKVTPSGVGGKPTVQVSGANVQIVNGEGNTASTNGAGNLVLGYDESPGTQWGSHNLVMGSKQSYTGSGAVLGADLTPLAQEVSEEGEIPAEVPAYGFTAVCPKGSVATSGGYQLGFNPKVHVTSSNPSTFGGSSWAIAISNELSVPANVKVWARCL